MPKLFPDEGPGLAHSARGAAARAVGRDPTAALTPRGEGAPAGSGLEGQLRPVNAPDASKQAIKFSWAEAAVLRWQRIGVALETWRAAAYSSMASYALWL